MKALTSNLTLRREQGFDVWVLANELVELAVVPELGAKLISLQDLRTGREWMWHPPSGRKLFRNSLGDDFATSPLVGMDECLPSITPCLHEGRLIPDHGEVWSLPWQLDDTAREHGLIKTTIALPRSPFELERTIELNENEVRLDYTLKNQSRMAEKFLWAMHPLLRLCAGDQLELPASTRNLLNDEAWLDDLIRSRLTNNCAKIFATPITEGLAAIHNATTNDRLEFAWSPAENNSLGIWLTRGGWHGHEHFALEPTNGNTDTLALAAARNNCHTVAAQSSVSWQVCLRVGI